MKDSKSIFSIWLSHAANFSGRSKRKEFWIIWPILYIIGLLAQCLLIIMAWEMDNIGLLIALKIITYIVLMFPAYALLSRRLHDTGHRSWWVFILWFCNITFHGAAIWTTVIFTCIVLYLCTKPSAPDNKYGPQEEN